MTKVVWDQVGERVYETGVDHGVLYLPNASGQYDTGVAWNGLTAVTETPSGAEASPQYADNIKYLNLVSNEEFGGTIEAFTYPKEFELCDGTARTTGGIAIGQQARRLFGLSYRTRVGNDLVATDFGYKLHLVYGALAAPTEKGYSTINDSPEAINFSWEFSTSPVEVPGFKPSALLTINSTEVSAAGLAALEDILYGTAGTDPRLPLPAEVFALFEGTITTTAQPAAPTYSAATDTITFPTVVGVQYYVDGVPQTDPLVVTKDTVVTAKPKAGYKFPAVSVDRWFVAYS